MMLPARSRVKPARRVKPRTWTVPEMLRTTDHEESAP
jgi:hypothetical protein